MNLNENNSAQITNNIITENNKSVSPPGIFAITISGISDLLMDYNDVWQGNPKRGELYRNVTPGAHDISVNPEFIDPANMDFRLKDSSACKTASSDGSEIGAYGIGGTPGVGLKLSLVQQMEVMFRVMNYLPDTVFKRTNFKHVLMQHLEIMEEHIKQADKTNNSSGLLNSAYQIAANTIIPRIDGCEVSGFPDKDDWVTDARAEEWIYSLISNLVDTLGGSIGRSEK